MFKEIKLPIINAHLFRKPTVNSEINKAIEIKNGNLATKNALIYCDILDLLNKTAKKREILKEKRQELQLSLYNAYCREQGLKTTPTKNSMSEQNYDDVNILLNEIKPKIELIKENRSKEKCGPKEKVIAAYKVYKRVLEKNDLSENQKNNLLKTIGYSEEGIKIIKNIATAAGLALILSPTYYSIEAAAFGTELTYNWISKLPFGINEENLKIALGISIAADILLAGVNTAVDIKLIRNKSIGTSPNLPATAIYYLLEKFMPSKKKTQNLVMLLASVVPTIIQDSIVFQPMSPIIAKNLVKSVLHIAEASVKFAYLKRKEMAEKKEIKLPLR